MTVQLSLALSNPVLRSKPPSEKTGQVFTRSWVVDAVLDLAGYVETVDLATKRAVEPAAGEGAFLTEMARRLVASCRLHGRHVSEAASSIVAYELDDGVADSARSATSLVLRDAGVPTSAAEALVDGWIRSADYLLTGPALPAPADFVIGNPPYIRLEDVPAGTAGTYRAMYPTMRGRADIYVAFFEAALLQLRSGGVVAFICADRWMLNAYGADLRRLVTSAYGVEVVVEMHNAPAFEDDVSAYPAVVVIRSAPQARCLIASVSGDVDTGPDGFTAERLLAAADGSPAAGLRGVRAGYADGWYSGAEPWPLVSPDRLRTLQYLEANFHSLEDGSTRVGIGVATGADSVFVTKDPTEVERSRLLPLAMASDTADGTLRWSGHYLVDPWAPEGLVDLAEYPRLAAYLADHEAVLRSRNVAGRNPRAWYRTIDRVAHGLTPMSKLYFPDIKGFAHPVLDRGKTYPHHNLYWITSTRWDLEVLGGILLSRVAQFFVECYSVRMRGGALRFQAQNLRRIRVPAPNAISPELADRFRTAFRDRDQASATAAALVAYGLDALPED